MFLIDTNVASEARKGSRANRGVIRFFHEAKSANHSVYISVISIGELRRGIELLRHRGDTGAGNALEDWLTDLLQDYQSRILDFDEDASQVWGRLCVPDPAHAIDKQIAAIALVNDLILVTRNLRDFARTGVRLFNPFVAA